VSWSVSWASMIAVPNREDGECMLDDRERDGRKAVGRWETADEAVEGIGVRVSGGCCVVRC
jgi:hypothetical protein